jgi:phosphatidylglycerol:prolipoprotein diacylglycerol transferase
VTVLPTPIYETVLMCLLAWGLWQLRDRVRPGVVFALYLLGSGFERFMIEFVRRNSEVVLGLTAPQIESLIAMAAGLIWLGVLVHRGGFAYLRAEDAPPERPRARPATA